MTAPRSVRLAGVDGRFYDGRTMSRPWVAIQFNPNSGSGRRRRCLLDLVQRLRQHDLRPRLFSRRERLAAALADPERRASLRCLVGAGGDGTIGDLFNRHPDLPIAVLPLGTENLLARFLKIRPSGRDLADLIAAGVTRRFDLGVTGDRRFLLVASAGFDADVIHRLHARRTGPITHGHYIPPILGALSRYDYPEMRVFLDDSPTPVSGRMVVVMNLPMYAFRLPIASCAAADDGLLDVRIFQRPSLFHLARYSCNLVLNRHERLGDVTSATVRRVRIESAVPVPLQIDGDPAGTTPTEISILPGALEVLAPE